MTTSESSPGCTRRTALAAGGAAVLLPAVLAESARATGGGEAVHPALRRTTWSELIDRDVMVDEVRLRVTEISDVAAAKARGLENSDEAFAVTLVGAGGIDGRIHGVAHDSFGALALFVAAVSADPGRYELVVDRSVKLPRAAEPAATGAPAAAILESAVAPLPADTPDAATSRETVRQRYRFLRSARVRRVRGRRRAELAFRKQARVKSVAVRVQRGDRLYATGTAIAASNAADVRLRLRRPMPRGGYSLVVTVEDRAGRITTTRRTLSVR